jgi:hypothetical protein
MDETGDHRVKQNKPDTGKQVLHVFSHIGKLQKFLNVDQKGKEQAIEKEKGKAGREDGRKDTHV